ncbi:hypothetical protein [Paenibacillus lautus]|uniref:hypothetical protein n=1 Tax=Paenibacillus lautus TaxID=1401 RepID=UPI003D9A23A7
MASKTSHKEFMYHRLLRVGAKTLNKERLLINLLPKLKHKGASPVTIGGKKVEDFESLYEHVFAESASFDGFEEHSAIVKKWLKDAAVDVLHRGKGNKEKFVSMRPLTLNAYKASNRKYREDYGISEQVYSMMLAADLELDNTGRKITEELKAYLSEGYDPDSDRVRTDDLELLETVVAMVVNPLGIDKADLRKTVNPHAPLCIGQARVLSADLMGLLAYKDAIPKSALLKAMVQMMYLHTGLFILRLGPLLQDLVERRELHPGCRSCPVQGDSDRGFHECPFQIKLQMDLGLGYASNLAKLSAKSVEHHERQIIQYIENHFYVRNLAEFFEKNRFVDENGYSVLDLFRELSDHENYMQDVHFSKRLDSFMEEMDEENDFLSLKVEGVPYIQSYVQLINKQYNGYYFHYFKQLMSSLFAKNEADGIMAQSGGYKKYLLGNELLDTLVHLVSIQPVEGGGYRTRRVRAEEFLTWMRRRYGFYIAESVFDAEEPELLQALRYNKSLFLSMLQDIGYYQPISDAYYTQWLIPRYEVDEVKGH